MDGKAGQLEIFLRKVGSVVSSGDKESVLALFLPNASLFVPNRPPLVGIRQIELFFSSLLGKADIEIDDYQLLQKDMTDNLAVIRSSGAGFYRVRCSGEMVPFYQKYLDVLRYDGEQWRLLHHVTSNVSDVPGFWDKTTESL